MKITYDLIGRIDSENAGDLEKDINSVISGEDLAPDTELEFNAAELEYISSAGLRVLLKCVKRLKNVSVTNVSPEIYNIFEVTGFTSMINIQKKLREVSVDGLPLIGTGANGNVYRLDNERIIKIYNPITCNPERIAREKTASKQALIHDIPTAISFDVVKSGDSYGIIYEMINSSTLGQFIAANPDKMEEYALKMADLLKKLHTTEFSPGSLPDARLSFHAWIDIAENSGYYSDEVISKMKEDVDNLPEQNTFIHGDFHPGNIMIVDNEPVLIDMTDSSIGSPIIDLAGSYHMMKLLPGKRPNAGRMYTGIPDDILVKMWDILFRSYTGINDDAEIREYERKLRHFSLIRSMAGIVFTKIASKEEFPELIKNTSNAFLNYL